MADVKPTPTQEENDRAALGEHVLEHEPDGSPPDPNVVAAQEAEKKRSEKEKELKSRHASASGERASYQTRQSQAPKTS